jgi:hypothetical protein
MLFRESINIKIAVLQLLEHISKVMCAIYSKLRIGVHRCSQNIKLFGFQIFSLWAYLMKGIPETRHAH